MLSEIWCKEFFSLPSFIRGAEFWTILVYLPFKTRVLQARLLFKSKALRVLAVLNVETARLFVLTPCALRSFNSCSLLANRNCCSQ